MNRYILRLDDACEKMNPDNWARMEAILDKYGVKPLVGIVPRCEYEKLNIFPADPNFWARAAAWTDKGWSIAMHGYNHVLSAKCPGINPVNGSSEFAGLPLEAQREKIRRGVEIMRAHGIEPEIFFAPCHTFDEMESDIRVISDTPAWDIYKKGDFIYIPVQSGRPRVMPMKTVTICCHPNTMREDEFELLERFIAAHKSKFADLRALEPSKTLRKFGIADKLVNKSYFFIKAIPHH